LNLPFTEALRVMTRGSLRFDHTETKDKRDGDERRTNLRAPTSYSFDTPTSYLFDIHCLPRRRTIASFKATICFTDTFR
jgi:hypothetical protein